MIMDDVRKGFVLVREKLGDWLEGLIGMLPNIATAVLIVVLSALAARLVLKAVAPLAARLITSTTLRRLLGMGLYISVMLMGVFAALSVLHLDKTVTSLLAGAGILGLAFSLAFQDLASNFIAGVVIATQHPIRIGDLVETAGQHGTVERINLRTTEIRSLQGIQTVVPNKEIFQNVLLNYSRNATRRVDLVVRVRLDADLPRVERVATEAVRGVDGVLASEEVVVFFQEFAESAVVFEVRFWITSGRNRHFHYVRSAAIKAIRAAFDREGIVIPAPVHTVEVDRTRGDLPPGAAGAGVGG
ncbi:MAG: mechanosensitive ion channel family protein [Flavobacteriales bacterium]|jgi:small-conductance mechanosensitive channel|nr:mechanosensitive ion channel family protein [Flavobacteriales bacterium]